MNKVSLTGEWNLSGKNYKTTAEIPGDFHTALLNSNIIDDPYYGFNEQDILWVGKTDWTIEREFLFNKDSNKKQILEITEADTFFTVYINNQLAGKGQNQFARHRFDISNFIKDGKNNIKILFESAEKKSAEIAATLPYPIPTMKYDVYSPNRNMARKCQCHGGWDWGPCLMVSGIYGDIFIEEVSKGVFDFATVFYKQLKDKKWEVTVKTSYDAFEDTELSLEYAVTGSDINKITTNINQKVIKGNNLFEVNLIVDNPSVWKTSGELKEENLLENTLYTLSINEAFDNICLNKSICFNTLKAISEKDFKEGKEGRSLFFENNGRKLFAKGSNWIPAENLPSRLTKARYEDLIKSAVEANHNIIRVWGGGIYEKEYFYDLCDKYGIIIWQDFMFACSMYPMTEDFINEVKKELHYQIPRLQTHACIGLWCGNNENFGALDWFPETNQNRVRYLVDYDRLYNGLIGTVVKEMDPSRLYWPSSPCSGPEDFADNWHSDNMGDMHYWSVWHERKDKEAYCSIRPRFVSEFGYESFPSMDTIKSFAESEDFNFTSKLMEYHQRSPSGNSIILENFSRYFRFPNGFENMIYLSQVQQAVAIRTAVDWWRSLKPHCYGAIVWQINDIWPGASWSSLEYSGKWKLLHYEEKKFFEDIYGTAFIKDKKLYLYMMNDSSQKVSSTIKIDFLDFSGNKISKTMTKKVSSKKDEILLVYEEDVLSDNINDYFIYVQFESTTSGKKSFVSDTTVFPCKYKHSNILKADIKKQITKISETEYHIQLKSEVPAFFVSLDTNEISGKFETNMITLLPNQIQSIKFYSDKTLTLEEVEKSISIKDLSSTY